MRKLRAINDNTIYDAPAKTINLARKMQSGEFGRVLDVIVSVRYRDDKGLHVKNYSFGSMQTGDAMIMVDSIKIDLVG